MKDRIIKISEKLIKIAEKLLRFTKKGTVDTLETPHTIINVEDITYHRGVIPLPSGTIEIKLEALSKAIDKYGFKDPYWRQLVQGFITSYLGADITEFGSAYIEFLYPGSPDYGLNVKVDYIDTSSLEVDWMDFVSYELEEIEDEEERKEKEEYFRSVFKDIKKLVEELNDYYYEAEEMIYEYIEDLRAIEKARMEMEAEEEEMKEKEMGEEEEEEWGG